MNYTLKTILRLLKREPKHTAGFRLNLGTALCSLSLQKAFTYRSGPNPRVEAEMHYAWRKRKGNLSIDPVLEANPHIIITGMSGFGKSTLFRSMLSDIKGAGISAIIFDPHGEHGSTIQSLGGTVHDAAYSGINLLDLDGATVGERTSELTSLFRNTYTLGYIQATKLSECLWYTYRKFGAASRNSRELKSTPTVKDLIAELNIFISNSRSASETNTLVHLRDRISLLNTPAFNGNAISVSALANGINSFSLSRMKSSEGRMIYITELLKRLYSTMHGSGIDDGVRLYMMIDEAQFLISNSDEGNEITKMIEEGRKYGMGVVVVTHAAGRLNRQITANASTFIAFYAREPQEVAYTSRLIAHGDSSKTQAVMARLGHLKKHEAMVISAAIRSPTVFRTNLPERQQQGKSDNPPQMAQLAERPILFEELKRKMGHADGAIIEGEIEAGGLTSFTLDTSKGKERWVMKPRASLSIEHEVYIRKIIAALDSLKIKNYIMDNSRGPDIVCYLNGKKTAIEYETGRKNFEETAKMIGKRRDEYGNVIVFVNDSKIAEYRKIEDITLFSASSVTDGSLSSWLLGLSALAPHG
ncbi:MAG TPA: ATP-binding protein [Candidatus Baltobacteraceae bacterium]|nr:ATP-binding protein [Candidatus Baltobacteraceae bacterium]